MFERFSAAARRSTVLAQEEARMLHHSRIAPAHLLLGLLLVDDPVVRASAAEVELSAASVRDVLRGTPTGPSLDADALAVVGIDLQEVRRAVEDTFGRGALDRGAELPTGHIGFTKAAKKCLELGLRTAVSMGSSRRGSVDRYEAGHLLLGVLRCEDPGVRRALGQVSPSALRDALTNRMAARAA
ncbi:MAG: Clp protease N-terminal domain-containing protein [Sciscionella sp.]